MLKSERELFQWCFPPPSQHACRATAPTSALLGQALKVKLPYLSNSELIRGGTHPHTPGSLSSDEFGQST